LEKELLHRIKINYNLYLNYTLLMLMHSCSKPHVIINAKTAREEALNSLRIVLMNLRHASPKVMGSKFQFISIYEQTLSQNFYNNRLLSSRHLSYEH
jgi:hypothetical protein